MKRLSLIAVALGAIALAVFALPASAQPPCEQFGSGTGNFWLPPDCKYYSPDELHMLEDQNQQVDLIALPIHQDFVCNEQSGGPGPGCMQNGGTLGGQVEIFSSNLQLDINDISGKGYSTSVLIPNVQVEVHSSPQNSSPVQTIVTDMQRIQAYMGPGNHPDFAEIEIVGGTANGFSSPGQTTATFDPSRNVWTLDSTFEVGYQIRFVGADGSPLDGLAGIFSGTVEMKAYGH